MVKRESSFPVLQGTVVILDLDRFKEYTTQYGLDEYEPNIITGTLSRLVSDLSSKHSGSILYGLDWERGTEEAILVFPGMDPLNIQNDLLNLAREMCSLGASITIVASREPMVIPSRLTQRELRRVFRRVYSILERLKRRGGGTVYVEGVIHRVCTNRLSGFGIKKQS